jgi:cell division protein FtsL
MSNQFDRISIQQSNIEEQQNIIKSQGKKYATQRNLLKMLFLLFILTLCLAVYSIYSRITISRKKGELEITNRKIKQQRNEIKKYSEELKQSNESRLNFFMGLSHEFKAKGIQ